MQTTAGQDPFGEVGKVTMIRMRLVDVELISNSLTQYVPLSAEESSLGASGIESFDASRSFIFSSLDNFARTLFCHILACSGERDVYFIVRWGGDVALFFSAAA